MLKRKMTRDQVLAFFANLPAAKIGIEACASAHYWAREISRLGHEVRLIAGQRVSRRVVGNKNDYRDAKAIGELRAEPETLYVPKGTSGDQHRGAAGCADAAPGSSAPGGIATFTVENRTALMLQARSLLGEYGMSFSQGASALRKALARALGGEHNGLSPSALETFADLQEQLTALDKRIDRYDERIQRLARQDAQAARLMGLPGVGPLTATASLSPCMLHIVASKLVFGRSA